MMMMDIRREMLNSSEKKAPIPLSQLAPLLLLLWPWVVLSLMDENNTGCLPAITLKMIFWLALHG